MSVEINALRDHFAIPKDERGAKWRHRFYDLVLNVPLHESDPRIVLGPDSFPYYSLTLDGERTAISIATLIPSATTRGFGIAVEPRGDRVEWVFSLGDLVTQREWGTFEMPRIGDGPVAETTTLRDTAFSVEEVAISAPTDRLLPAYLRPLLRRYFETILGIADPGVLALHVDDDHHPEGRLIFTIHRGQFKDDAAYTSAATGVSWFLPRHASVVLLQPDRYQELASDFFPL